jgi:hypothetical protein
LVMAILITHLYRPTNEDTPENAHILVKSVASDLPNVETYVLTRSSMINPSPTNAVSMNAANSSPSSAISRLVLF